MLKNLVFKLFRPPDLNVVFSGPSMRPFTPTWTVPEFCKNSRAPNLASIWRPKIRHVNKNAYETLHILIICFYWFSYLNCSLFFVLLFLLSCVFVHFFFLNLFFLLYFALFLTKSKYQKHFSFYMFFGPSRFLFAPF